MKATASFLVLASFLIFAANCSGEIVCPPDGCRQQIKDYCRNPKNALPNLILSKTVTLKGVVRDETGARFAQYPAGTIVLLRKWKTTKTLASDKVKVDGSFELGSVKPGRYRLLVVVDDQGKLIRFRGQVQPKEMSCADGQECALAVKLPPGSSEDFEQYCAIR